MAALTAPKKQTRLGDALPHSPIGLGLKASTKVWKGSLVVNDAGVMAPGRTATTLVTIGVAIDTYDNTSGAANAITGEAECGVFLFENSASADLITNSEIGKDCYIVDDQTVAKTDGTSTRSKAGKVVGIVGTQVAVLVGVGF